MIVELLAREPPVAPKIIEVIPISLGCLLDLDEETQTFGFQDIEKLSRNQARIFLHSS